MPGPHNGWTRPHGGRAQGTGTKEAVHKRQILACREMLKSVNQAVKLLALYGPSHPVPASALQQSWNLLRDLMSSADWKESVIGLVEGRWVVNDRVISEISEPTEVIAAAYKAHHLRTVTFNIHIRLHELLAFCELCAQTSSPEDIDPSDFLKKRGVKNIRVNSEHYTRAPGKPKPAQGIPSPIPAKAATRPGRRGGFGSFLKELVDKSVDDPQTRAQIYSEVVRSVKDAIARRVGQATKQLTTEKNRAVNERVRSESVVASMAEGKVVVDKEGRVLMMDPAAQEMIGKSLIDLAGKPILDSIIPGKQMVALAKNIEIKDDDSLPPGKVRVVAADDVIKAFRQSMALVQDEQGRLVGTFASMPHEAKYREAMKVQEEFISHVTHDLKSPLASISAALDLIANLAGPRMTAQERRFLDISRTNSQRLRHMIDELLDFSKVQNGEMTIHRVFFSVENVLSEAVEGLKPWSLTRELDLHVDQNAKIKGLPQVFGDQGRVIQVFHNLISNAIKCTSKGGKIRVAAALGEGEREGSVVFSVSDTGRGIAKEDQKKIFERFQQVRGIGKRVEGVGLGLTIVKEIVRLHDGHLWLESEEDKGSTFYFSLPINEPQGESDTEPQAESDV